MPLQSNSPRMVAPARHNTPQPRSKARVTSNRRACAKHFHTPSIIIPRGSEELIHEMPINRTANIEGLLIATIIPSGTDAGSPETLAGLLKCSYNGLSLANDVLRLSCRLPLQSLPSNNVDPAHHRALDGCTCTTCCAVGTSWLNGSGSFRASFAYAHICTSLAGRP